MLIFLDESGDLGFDFTKSGTSSFFTITLLVCDDMAVYTHVRKAVQRTLQNKINRKRKRLPVQELKGNAVAYEHKRYFLSHMPKQGWHLYSISVVKRNVEASLTTKNGKIKLYNYLSKKLFEKFKPNHTPSHIHVIADKCKNKDERHDFDSYIKTYLETAMPPSTALNILHADSQNTPGLQAVDMFGHGIYRSHEHSDTKWLDDFSNFVKKNERYFSTK